MTRPGLTLISSPTAAAVLWRRKTPAAIDVGARHGHKMIEFDAKLAQDGQIFLLHDDTLDRTSNGWGVAGELGQTGAAGRRQLVQLGLQGRAVAAVVGGGGTLPEHGLMANIEIKPTTGSDDETGRVVALAAAAGKGRPIRCFPPSR